MAAVPGTVVLHSTEVDDAKENRPESTSDAPLPMLVDPCSRLIGVDSQLVYFRAFNREIFINRLIEKAVD